MNRLTAVVTSGELPQTLAELSSAVRAWGVPEDRAEDIRTAVEESCRNALEHAEANSGRDPSVEVTDDGRAVHVVVQSSGLPFVLPAVKPDLGKKLEGVEPARGWGLFLVQALSDDVSVESRNGVNRIRLTFVYRDPTKGAERA